MNADQNRKNILLVDDDSDYSELMRMRLETAGYSVDCASDGREALEWLERGLNPSLIILDLDMPDQNGLTTLINLGVRKNGNEENRLREVPVIVATGLQSEKVEQLIRAQKVNGYLKKPYPSEDLIRTIKKLIG